MKSKSNTKRLSILLTMTLGVFICLGGMPAWCAKQPINNKTVCDAVEDELLFDEAVDPHQIDAACNDGIVTLEGIVNNIMVKERALKIAETVKGVRAVVNNIHVVPSVFRSDLAIEDDVIDSLLQDPATDSYEIDVAVSDNVVTLKGTVESWQESRLCEKVAKGVNGVTAVVNQIDVKYKSKRPDREIKQEIEQTLKWDILVDHELILVEVDNGKVRLSGIVGSAAERTHAISDAYLIAGVESLDANDLKVMKWARDKNLRKSKYVVKSDQAIYEAVKDALMYDPRVFSFNVEPEVSNGIVTLRGTVDNLKAKRSAAQDARNTVGVLIVHNRLNVRPQAPVTDETIAKRVEQGMARDPYVERYEISVISNNGIVDLYGDVDSYFEKAHAEELASRVNGVIAVDNNLSVNDDYEAYYYSPYVDDWYVYDYDWYHHMPQYTFKSDVTIKKEIESELFWSPFVDLDDVTVSVEDGVATLSGSVDSAMEYYAATENAYEGGATFVDNDLVIETQ